MFGRYGYTLCRHGEPTVKDGKTFCAPKRTRQYCEGCNTYVSSYCQGCKTYTRHYNGVCRYCPRDV